MMMALLIYTHIIIKTYFPDYYVNNERLIFDQL